MIYGGRNSNSRLFDEENELISRLVFFSSTLTRMCGNVGFFLWNLRGSFHAHGAPDVPPFAFFFSREKKFLWPGIIIFLFGLFRLRRYLPRAAIKKKTEKWQQSGSGVFLFSLAEVVGCPPLPATDNHCFTWTRSRVDCSVNYGYTISSSIFFLLLRFLHFVERIFWRGGAAEWNQIKQRKTK